MKSSHNPIIELSVRLYRFMMFVYPRDHRNKYGFLMVQVFHDKALAVCQKTGMRGLIVYWLRTLLDLVVSAPREYHEYNADISDENLRGLHPSLLIASGVLFCFASISQLQPDDHWQFYGIYALSMTGLPVAFITLVSGLYGLKTWLDNQTSLLSRFWLRVSLYGGIFAPILIFMLPISEVIWALMMLGFVMLLSGIVAIGIDTLISRTFPLSISLLLIVSGITPFITVPVEPNHFGPRYVSTVGILVVGLCWIVIGNYLRKRANATIVFKEI